MIIKTTLLLLSLFIFLSINANAATFTVTKIADTNDGVCNSDCSLREAIVESNLTTANDVIVFDASVFATPQTITLGGTELGIANNGSLTINGLNGLTISGNNMSRVFLINQLAVAVLTNLTISNGRSDLGGGIFNDNGTLTIKNSTISNNVAAGILGGSGGGIANGGVLNIINSTLSGNEAVSVSSGGLGGAIYNIATLRLTNATIAFNTAPAGGGIWNIGLSATSGNSIIANNFGSTAFDFFGTLTSQGYNLIGNTNNTTIIGTTTGNILDVIAQLGPLANNGGGSFTHALLAGSPAFNTGSNALAIDENSQPLTTDQRGAGFIRQVGLNVDIGAYEFLTPLSNTTNAATSVTHFASTLNGNATPNAVETTGWFRYSTTNPGTCDDTFGIRAPVSSGSSLGMGTLPTPYAQSISGLNAGTTYFYCAIVQNSTGFAFGSIQQFTTLPPPTATTNAATSVTHFTATLNGEGNPNGLETTGWFRYSTTNPGTCNDTFGIRAPLSGGSPLGAGVGNAAYGQAISGLNAETTYFYCAIVQNAAGFAFGAIQQFTTLPLPTATTIAIYPLNIKQSTAKLNGAGNPNGLDTNGWFRYSTTNPGTCNDTFGVRAPASGGSPLGSGFGNVGFVRDIGGLMPSTTYFYCAIVQNIAGLSFGAIEQFTTAPTCSSNVPELMYYKFDGSGTTVPNLASSPVGTNPAPLLGGLTQGGVGFIGGGLIGSGASSGSDFVNTGWAPNLTGQSWTISLYLNNIQPSSILFYFFGDDNSGSFRAFTNGVAGANNIILRGTNMADVLAVGGAQIGVPNVTHFVYDSAANNIKAYVNGVLVTTVAQLPGGPTFSGAGPFKVGGFSLNTGLPMGGVMDEFRLYNRTLSAGEIAATLTATLPCTPTAASANVSGRVFSPFGRGVANAYVVVTNQNGESVRTRTNPFGYYRFNDVRSGETYVFSVQSKRFRFASQVVNVDENLDDLNFTAQSNLRPEVNEADYCVIQFPSTVTVSGGVETPFISGQIFEIGITNPPGSSPLITAQVGYGTAGSDPRTAAGWTYFPAVFDLQSGQNDEYRGTITSPTVGGTYSYVYRFSFDSGLNWSYADLDGAGTNPGLSFNPNNLGTMTVNAPTAASVSVSGRVFTPFGRGLANAFVVKTNQNGESVRARTNQLGYYRFSDIAAGETYIFSVASKRFQFASQVVSVEENLDGLNFFAQ